MTLPRRLLADCATSEQLSAGRIVRGRRRSSRHRSALATPSQVFGGWYWQEGGRGRWLEEQVSHLEAAAAEARGGFGLGQIARSRAASLRSSVPHPSVHVPDFWHFVQCIVPCSSAVRFALCTSQQSVHGDGVWALTQRDFCKKFKVLRASRDYRGSARVCVDA